MFSSRMKSRGNAEQRVASGAGSGSGHGQGHGHGRMAMSLLKRVGGHVAGAVDDMISPHDRASSISPPPRAASVPPAVAAAVVRVQASQSCDQICQSTTSSRAA